MLLFGHHIAILRATYPTITATQTACSFSRTKGLRKHDVLQQRLVGILGLGGSEASRLFTVYIYRYVFKSLAITTIKASARATDLKSKNTAGPNQQVHPTMCDFKKTFGGSVGFLFTQPAIRLSAGTATATKNNIRRTTCRKSFGLRSA